MQKRITIIVFMSVLALAAASPAHGEGGKPANAADVYRRAFKLLEAIPNEQTRAVFEEDDDGVRPLSEAQKKLVAATDEVMRLVAEGNKVERCEWEEPFLRNPYTWNPGESLARSRLLGRIACLRARSHFDAGQAQKAIEELFSAWTLGRRISRGGTIIAALVQVSIDAMFLSEIAARLPGMDQKTRAQVRQRIDALPKADTLRDAADRERQSVVRWFREEVPKDVDARVAEWEGYYRKSFEFVKTLTNKEEPFDAKRFHALRDLAKKDKRRYLAEVDALNKQWASLLEIFDASPEKLDAAGQAWKRGVDETRLLSAELGGGALEATVKLPTTEHRVVVLHAMMKAGLAVLDEGDDALKKHREPYSDAMFRMQKFAGGFELFSVNYKIGDEPWSLRFGRKGK